MTDSGKTLLTDLYQLTMNAAYVYSDKDDMATFDLFIRALPPDWGYFIACGIEDAIDYLTTIRFDHEDLDYLKQHGFRDDYLEFLKDFSFVGDVMAVREGTPVFPAEPILRVTAKRTQAQFVETALLNAISFQTMIATKASRIVTAAHPARVIDFGLRRAQEESAGLKGAYAAYIGGAAATSNVKAGRLYDIPLAGTHAHSFVMSYESELEAFRSYAAAFPDSPTLLIDTYDTLQGAQHACTIARELQQQGKQLGAVRLDSGDLAQLSKDVRALFDREGLNQIKIFASSDLNEYKIHELIRQQAPIDGYGVGTELITAKPVAAISGVYKLAEDTAGPKIKLSPDKQTLPGKKQLFRITSPDGTFENDIITLEHEQIDAAPLLEPVITQGNRLKTRQGITQTRNYCQEALFRIPAALKEPRTREAYPVNLSQPLRDLIDRLTENHSP